MDAPLTLYFIYMHFNVCVTSVVPGSTLFYLFVRHNFMTLKVNSTDPDQTTRMCQLIWIYTVHQCNKGVSME